MGEEKDQEGYDSCIGTAHDHRDNQDSDDSEVQDGLYPYLCRLNSERPVLYSG
jgi:hypothetical protein